ncbi:unnamed protein product, partial [Scytosiphon promiscuus]
MRQGQGMAQGMGQGMQQARDFGYQGGYGVAANGQGLGVNHMAGVQGVGSVNGQVKERDSGTGIGRARVPAIRAARRGEVVIPGLGWDAARWCGTARDRSGQRAASMLSRAAFFLSGGAMSAMNMGDYSLEDVLGPFPCVRLRGLPFEATVDDVLRFFSGLVPLDVVMVTRADGRGAGEAIVVLTNVMEMQMALSRDKQHMGRRYIEIFQSKRMDYYSAIVGQLQAQVRTKTSRGERQPKRGKGPERRKKKDLHPPRFSSRRLPFSATKQDVINFFQGMPVTEESIQFVVRGDGRVTGEAFRSGGDKASTEKRQPHGHPLRGALSIYPRGDRAAHEQDLR